MGNSKEQSIAQTDKPKSVPLEATEAVCPSCSCANDGSALFCEECGSVLKQPAHCPKCHAIARPHADICEVCGTWLLKGQCTFCYAHVDQDQSFCGECGNPPEGIACPRCGKLSIFDFCKSCNIPLSIQAKEMAKEAAQDPTFKEIASLFEQLTSVETSLPVTTNKTDPIKRNHATGAKILYDQALKLKAYRESQFRSTVEQKPKSTPKALFSGNQKESISQLADEVAQEEDRRRIEEEKRRQEEERKRREEEERQRQEEERRRQEAERQRRLQEQVNNAMRKLSGKTFSSNQEARRFFMNLIASLPEEVARKITDRGMSWRCNAFGCVHNSPSECGDPSRGGVWLLR